MKRGEVWTVSGGPGYAGKPRPVVIVQDDRFDTTASITVCGLTSAEIDAPLARPMIAPTVSNGLKVQSFPMVDKITTVPRQRLGRRIGTLSRGDIALLNAALLVFLALAG